MYPNGYKEYQANLAPLTLFPTPFPRIEFEKAKSIATAYNKLYANIVSQHQWLLDAVRSLSEFDTTFTGKLYQCYLEAEKRGIVQPVALGLVRSDYMYDTVSKVIKQVEYNTVSVSFAGISREVGKLHKFLNDSGLYTKSGEKYYGEDGLIVSDAADGLARGLREAVSYYERTHSSPGKTIVLFVVQPNERNAFDQRHIEYSLFEKFGIVSKRIELPDVTASVKVDNQTRKLFYQDREVSVVYYRSAYGPGEFTKKETWDCRILLESTLAIKCPSLLVQLSGAKKIQQLLTSTAILDKFLPTDEKKADLVSTFCKIYPLDDSEDATIAKKLAFEKPENFVLKPQREGGGNNIYKEEIPGFLKSIPEKDWAGFILMELIHPPVAKNVMLRDGELLRSGTVSELGVYGSFLFNEKTGKIIHNEYQGHLLRSKISSSNEGGVAAGYGCVDSLYLI
ncbi:DEKNAAC102008 [Brettanomyces naardenensis]|uniref:Glutathione synthetase n=1 Tax=Brettanomyces naardenensis TaxID=13370 RepID=A0A448YJC4_BRENA|nr:DEKNAAC102008 [Brettanomyces naardenensis]